MKLLFFLIVRRDFGWLVNGISQELILALSNVTVNRTSHTCYFTSIVSDKYHKELFEMMVFGFKYF